MVPYDSPFSRCMIITGRMCSPIIFLAEADCCNNCWPSLKNRIRQLKDNSFSMDRDDSQLDSSPRSLKHKSCKNSNTGSCIYDKILVFALSGDFHDVKSIICCNACNNKNMQKQTIAIGMSFIVSILCIVSYIAKRCFRRIPYSNNPVIQE